MLRSLVIHKELYEEFFHFLWGENGYRKVQMASALWTVDPSLPFQLVPLPHFAQYR
jgi:hypothetical protein